MKFSLFTNKDIKEVFDILKSSERGLSEKEAVSLQRIHGSNEIKAREIGAFDVLLRQFKSPFFYLLFIAAAIYFAIGEITNGFLILGFVFINVFLGFFQEYRAEKTSSLLKSFIPSRVRVKREGKEKIIDKKLLVPGDIVLLEAGNIVPAEVRILKAENVLVDESVLTGESVPVFKFTEALSKETKEIFEAKNILFAGTSLISGEAEGLVIGTGKNTVWGEITKIVAGVTRESIYEKDLLRFSRIILRTVVVSIVFIFLLNLIIKGTTNLLDFSIFCIALIVSIIPEALPLVVTFSLSRGALKLAKEKVVTKRLSALEDLGDIEILCSDKTGTLTENKLQLSNINSSNKEKCLLYGLLTSSYMREEIESSVNPFDFALFEAAPKEIKRSLKEYEVIAEASFHPSTLRNSTLLKDKRGNLILISRGAPEKILELCLSFKSERNIKKEMEREGQEGKRVLAISFKEINPVRKGGALNSITPSEKEGGLYSAPSQGAGLSNGVKEEFTGRDFFQEKEKELTFLGYFSFFDPLKKTTKEAIRLSEKLGVQIKIITGDSKEVAGWVAKETGLIEDPKEVISGAELEALSKEELERKCQDFSVFARVSPQAKYKIVETLQKKYEVGFLGEGINDAPALKISNVAIAVEGAADISREAADIILLKKDLKVIIEGIKNGRNIFSNINKYIKCTIASNFGNFYSIAVVSLMIPFLPMLPIQVLLVNLLSDFPLIAVTTDRIDAEELRKPKFHRLNKMIFLIILLALVSTIFDFLFFWIFHKVQPGLLQTLWFIESILTEIFLIYSIRTFHSFWKARFPSLALISLSLLTVILTVSLPFTNFGQNIFSFSAPPLSALLIVFILVLSYFLVSEIVKLVFFHSRLKNSFLGLPVKKEAN